MKFKLIFLMLAIAICTSVNGNARTPQEEAWSYYYQGVRYMEQQRYADAIGSFNFAIRLDPANCNPWERRGTAFFDLGNYQQAISDYTQALNLHPKYDFCYAERALAYFSLGNSDAAMRDMITAARLGNNLAQIALRERGIPW
jgi:tetratricopeptide (TPR) repeat protein